jgi:shikimate dehydrogenase
VTESPIQEIVCLMGLPVAGNPTQFMMERAFAATGLDWRYLTLEVPPERLAEAIRGLRALGFKGAHLTVPHKVSVIPYLDALSPSAELMGVVNCVTREGDRLTGENTEGQGFLRSLQGVLDLQGKKVLILGAGGSARAIAVEIGLAGAAEITIVNRTAERGQALVDLLNGRVKVVTRLVHLSGDYVVEEGTHLIVNATTIRSSENGPRIPLALSSLPAESVVADVTVNPPQTKFLRDAAARGCPTVDGLSMLVNQGVIAFKIWTGVDPDPTVMREALEEYLEI